MMTDRYKTVLKPGEGIYKEKGSKFLSFSFRVENEDHVSQRLNDIKNKFHDARHHCYAYVLGPEGEIFRSNDDGEPRHTAGDPILNQIRSYDLTNILLVVVRYFGGTKLGKSGLIQAYKAASVNALENTQIVEKIITNRIRIFFEYSVLNDIMKLISEKNLNLKDQKYGDSCMIELSVPLMETDQVIAIFQSTNLALKIEKLTS